MVPRQGLAGRDLSARVARPPPGAPPGPTFYGPGELSVTTGARQRRGVGPPERAGLGGTFLGARALWQLPVQPVPPSPAPLVALPRPVPDLSLSHGWCPAPHCCFAAKSAFTLRVPTVQAQGQEHLARTSEAAGGGPWLWPLPVRGRGQDVWPDQDTAPSLVLGVSACGGMGGGRLPPCHPQRTLTSGHCAPGCCSGRRLATRSRSPCFVGRVRALVARPPPACNGPPLRVPAHPQEEAQTWGQGVPLASHTWAHPQPGHLEEGEVARRPISARPVSCLGQWVQYFSKVFSPPH